MYSTKLQGKINDVNKKGSTYGSEEEERWSKFEEIVLRRIFGLKKDESSKCLVKLQKKISEFIAAISSSKCLYNK
jgi:hypothetical protein